MIGTVSVPFSLQKMLHLEMRLIVSPSPTKNPHSAKLELAYIEQVGVNLHAWGINGEMQNLNIDIKKIAIYFGIAKMHLKNFFMINQFSLTYKIFEIRFLICKLGLQNIFLC